MFSFSMTYPYDTDARILDSQKLCRGALIVKIILVLIYHAIIGTNSLTSMILSINSKWDFPNNGNFLCLQISFVKKKQALSLSKLYVHTNSA